MWRKRRARIDLDRKVSADRVGPHICSLNSEAHPKETCPNAWSNPRDIGIVAGEMTPTRSNPYLFFDFDYDEERGERVHIYVSLHTADPEDGDQATHECTYDGYARVAVPDLGAWIIADSIGAEPETIRPIFRESPSGILPPRSVDFPQATAGLERVTHYGAGTDERGGGRLLLSGALKRWICVSNGITPRLSLDPGVFSEV